jgi:hypothetical protein
MRNPLCEVAMTKEGPAPVFRDKLGAAAQIIMALGMIPLKHLARHPSAGETTFRGAGNAVISAQRSGEVRVVNRMKYLIVLVDRSILNEETTSHVPRAARSGRCQWKSASGKRKRI